MKNLTYVGDSDFRVIRPEDIRDYQGEDFGELRWSPGYILEVPDEVAAFLLEWCPTQFREPENMSSAQKTKAQLLDEARDYNIEGRSSMTKDELIAALDEVKRNEVNAELEGSTVESSVAPADGDGIDESNDATHHDGTGEPVPEETHDVADRT